MTRATPSTWSKPPHCILHVGSPADLIPIYPPEGFTGTPALYLARTRREFKGIPDWELLVCFLRGPDLVFANEDRGWFRDRWERLVAIRRAARKAAKEGDRVEFYKMLTELRIRWRVLVQRSSGYQVMGGKVTSW